MSIGDLNKALRDSSGLRPLFVFITGASGAGKTTVTKSLQAEVLQELSVFAYFDSIGVPAPDEMIREFGSGEKWQEITTHEWVRRLVKAAGKSLRVLEGQYNPNFVVEACRAEGVDNYVIIDVHSQDAVREERLKNQRQQPELASLNMRNWANFIKRETEKLGGVVLDNSTDRAVTLDTISKVIIAKLKAA